MRIIARMLSIMFLIGLVRWDAHTDTLNASDAFLVASMCLACATFWQLADGDK